MADKHENPVDAAAFADSVERERKLSLFRSGKLPFVEAERVTAELCAAGDAAKRARDEQATREERERGARLRAGVI
jgi:hypothetical protein